MQDQDKKRLEGWAVLELMGHRRIGGYVVEEERFGVPMARVDVPLEDGQTLTQHYGGSAIYCISWVGEREARAVARQADPRPVTPWELREEPRALPAYEPIDDGDHDGDDLEPVDEVAP